MSKKKVTAPTTYNPGSGHPKEYLAYLNWQEMEALRRLNGNGPRRGPKGIPSFADDSASSLGNERQPESAYSGYQGGGDGGFSGNSYSDAGGESGGGGYGGGNYGGGDYGGNSYNDVGGVQSSPSYQSQSPTYSSLSAPATQNISESNDESVQRAVEANNNAEAVKTPALSDDSRRPSYSYPSYRTPSDSYISGAISRLSSQVYGGVVPTGPGAGGGFGSIDTRRSSLLSPVGPSSGIEALGNVGPTRSALSGSTPGFPSGIDIKLPTSYPDAPSGQFGPVSPIKTYYPDAPQGSFGPRISSPISRRPTDPDLERFSAPTAAPATLGYGGIPAATIRPELAPYLAGESVGPLAEKAYNSVRDAVGNAYKAIGNYFSPGVPSGGISDLGGIPSLEIANKSPDVTNDISMSVVGGMGMAAIPGSENSQKLSPFTNPGLRNIAYGSPEATPVAEREYRPYDVQALSKPSYRPYDVRYGQPSVVEVSSEPSISPPQDDVYPASQETILEVETVPPEVPTEVYGPIYVDPEIQKIMRDQEKKNRTMARLGRFGLSTFGGPVGGIASLGLAGANKLTKLFTGSDLLSKATEAKRALLQAHSPEERERIIAEHPELIGFERTIGRDVSPEDAAAYQAYRENAGIIPRGMPVPGTGGSIYQGGTPIKELGGKNPWWEQQRISARAPYEPDRYASTTGSPSKDTTALEDKYLLWDNGIGIPSPGDPDYNEYQKYLKIRDQEGTA